MSLEEVFETEPTITRHQAVRCVLSHGVSVDEFEAECGVSSTYNARTVLEWLGY